MQMGAWDKTCVCSAGVNVTRCSVLGVQNLKNKQTNPTRLPHSGIVFRHKQDLSPKIASKVLVAKLVSSLSEDAVDPHPRTSEQ